MSRFTVVWTRDAVGRLANVWMNAVDVAAAADRIDAELANNPLGTGDPVREGLFRIEYAPLSVIFSVREPDRVVMIEFVRHL